MNKLIVEIVAGLTLMEILRWNSSVSQKSCIYSYDKEGYYHADCAGRNITDVPQNLEATIESLDLSQNIIKAVDSNSFKKYRNLVKIWMCYMRINEHTPAFKVDSFTKLNKLEYINLTHSQYNVEFELRWPLNIRIIVISHNKLQALNIDHLEKLEELHANDIIIVNFPRFHRHAPLRVIELQEVPLSKIKIVDIAPFCLLQVLLLKFSGGRYFQSSDNYCDCKKLDLWVNTFKIKNNPLSCSPPFDESKAKCNLVFDPNELKLRDDCFVANSRLWIIFLILFLLILLVLISIALYLYWRRRKENVAEVTNEPAPSESDEEKLSEEELQQEDLQNKNEEELQQEGLQNKNEEENSKP